MISNCGSSENGTANGAVGDQTGREYRIRSWYKRNDFLCVLRYPDSRVRVSIAENAKRAANNSHIGYGQRDRLGMYAHCAASNWDPGKITIDCNADCSASTCAVVICVGHQLNIPSLQKISPSLTTYTMKGPFVAAGFEVLTGDKYKTSENYLIPGDIILCREHVYIEVGAGNTTANAENATANHTNVEGKKVTQYAGIIKLSSSDPTKSWLNVRTMPNQNAPIVQIGNPAHDFALPSGMPVSIEQEFGNWGKLTGFNGWISLQYLKR